ncbi:MAG: HrpE/YscL family type III secretion apparatus protein [Gammaproteobacteria bacterium]|nr:HrpE/YscL family type III secretion apparatus protein [Gammaproteobacteria bacterium]
MAEYVRLNPNHPAMAPGRKILSAEDYELRVSAENLLEEARKEACQIAEDARIAFQEEKQRGYDDGMAAAQADIAEQMITIVTRSIDYLATAEGEVAKTVILCLKKILGDSPEEELVVQAARQALHVVRNENRITLTVRPEVQAEVQARIGEILQGHGEVSFLEVVGDPGMERGGCRLETEIGVVDASIDLQINALERAIQERVKGKS